MEQDVAVEIRHHALAAVRSLSDALEACKDRCSTEEYQEVKRGVGLSIGRIETELLSIIQEIPRAG